MSEKTFLSSWIVAWLPHPTRDIQTSVYPWTEDACRDFLLQTGLALSCGARPSETAVPVTMGQLTPASPVTTTAAAGSTTKKQQQQQQQAMSSPVHMLENSDLASPGALRMRRQEEDQLKEQLRFLVAIKEKQFLVAAAERQRQQQQQQLLMMQKDGGSSSSSSDGEESSSDDDAEGKLPVEKTPVSKIVPKTDASSPVDEPKKDQQKIPAADVSVNDADAAANNNTTSAPQPAALPRFPGLSPKELTSAFLPYHYWMNTGPLAAIAVSAAWRTAFHVEPVEQLSEAEGQLLRLLELERLLEAGGDNQEQQQQLQNEKQQLDMEHSATCRALYDAVVEDRSLAATHLRGMISRKILLDRFSVREWTFLWHLICGPRATAQRWFRKVMKDEEQQQQPTAAGSTDKKQRPSSGGGGSSRRKANSAATAAAAMSGNSLTTPSVRSSGAGANSSGTGASSGALDASAARTPSFFATHSQLPTWRFDRNAVNVPVPAPTCPTRREAIQFEVRGLYFAVLEQYDIGKMERKSTTTTIAGNAGGGAATTTATSNNNNSNTSDAASQQSGGGGVAARQLTFEEPEGRASKVDKAAAVAPKRATAKKSASAVTTSKAPAAVAPSKKVTTKTTSSAAAPARRQRGKEDEESAVEQQKPKPKGKKIAAAVTTTATSTTSDAAASVPPAVPAQPVTTLASTVLFNVVNPALLPEALVGGSPRDMFNPAAATTAATTTRRRGAEAAADGARGKPSDDSTGEMEVSLASAQQQKQQEGKTVTIVMAPNSHQHSGTQPRGSGGAWQLMNARDGATMSTNGASAAAPPPAFREYYRLCERAIADASLDVRDKEYLASRM